MKLTQLKNSEVLPQKREIIQSIIGSLHNVSNGGFNEAVSSLEKVELVMDSKALAELIQNIFNERTKYVQDYHSHKLNVKGNRPKFVSKPISECVANGVIQSSHLFLSLRMSE